MEEAFEIECDIKIEQEELEYCEDTDIYEEDLPRSSCGSTEPYDSTAVSINNRNPSSQTEEASEEKCAWKKYMEQQDSQSTYYCSKCPFETSWKCYLKSHMRKIHGSPNEIETFKCVHCDFHTKWRFSLVNHMKVHISAEKLRMYKCKECPYQSKWQNGLTSHMKVHMLPKIPKVKTYTCTVCSHETKNKNAMKEHQKVHNPHLTSETFKCPLCDFKTKFRHGVNKHVKVHNNAK